MAKVVSLTCKDYFKKVIENAFLKHADYYDEIEIEPHGVIKHILCYNDESVDLFTEEDEDLLFEYIIELYESLVSLLSEDYRGIDDRHIEQEVSYYDDDRHYITEGIYDYIAKIESTCDFIVSCHPEEGDSCSLVLYSYCEIDKLQLLFMEVIKKIYTKYEKEPDTWFLLKPSDFETIEYFTIDKYIETLHCVDEKKDVVKCILYCLERRDEIPPELALLILSFMEFEKRTLFETHFSLLNVDEDYMSSLY